MNDLGPDRFLAQHLDGLEHAIDEDLFRTTNIHTILILIILWSTLDQHSITGRIIKLDLDDLGLD